jgi:uncharacterized membrane protein/nitrite reductase/ring-hydroxylating ferredoxin subunit
MKSKASIRSHPIHPILICFPVALFTATFVFDVCSVLFDNPALSGSAYYTTMAGVIGAIAAAIPGIIDYTCTVPPKSSAKKRAATHGLLNTIMLLIFIGTLLYRKDGDGSIYVLIGAEAVGLVLMFISGWLGGTLVYRNQIGVDPRYADAGKWQELRIGNTSGPIRVAAADELSRDQMKLVVVDGKRIAIARTETSWVAFDDRCSHKGGSLAGGAMICSTVQCPWHGSQFDTVTGAMKAGPGKEGISTYKIFEDAGHVYLSL